MQIKLIFGALVCSAMIIQAGYAEGTHCTFFPRSIFAWLKDCKTAIQKTAVQEKISIKRNVICKVALDKYGNAANVVITQSSKDQGVDNQAKILIRESGPFPAFPGCTELVVKFDTSNDVSVYSESIYRQTQSK